ncbi:MAG: methyltransferase domain-containing protein [Gammaproteobacteria bacterium]|nr:methyltransferase domain-containing protein [Gammaproteobacteria bacterium]
MTTKEVLGSLGALLMVVVLLVAILRLDGSTLIVVVPIFCLMFAAFCSLIVPEFKDLFAYFWRLFKPPKVPEDVAQSTNVGPGADTAEPTLQQVDETSMLSSMFMTSVPTYILNKDYRFLDWNPAFELIFRDVPGLRRGEHVSRWSPFLEDAEKVAEHGRRVFGNPDGPPLIDQEVLRYVSPEFGRITFFKIASPVHDTNSGEILGWISVLNIKRVANGHAYQIRLQDVLEWQVRWTKYAASYDHVLNEFGEYQALLELHLSAMNDCKRVMDLGAGTGNLTVRLLETSKEVVAIESNAGMYTHLVIRCATYKDNLKIVRRDIDNIGKIESQYYDGAVLMNVLMYLKDPQACLNLIYGGLAPKGVLALSVPNESADLDRLFSALRSDLQAKGKFDELREHYDNIYAINQMMEKNEQLPKYTVTQLEGMVKRAGFSTIIAQDTDAYAGQAIFLAARK